LDDIHGLKPFLYFAPNWKLALLVGLGVMAAMALVVWFLRRKPAPVADMVLAPAKAVPARSVREQLDALKAGRLIEKGRFKDFHGGLSAIVRGYLGSRFSLPGRRLTTTELLAALERQPIEQPVYQLIADLLPECDMVKFADAHPTVAEMEARLATAYYLVERLGDAPNQEDPDGPEELGLPSREPGEGSAVTGRLPDVQGGPLDVVG
jgi:hypothetical protein